MLALIFRYAMSGLYLCDHVKLGKLCWLFFNTKGIAVRCFCHILSARVFIKELGPGNVREGSAMTGLEYSRQSSMR